jgi:tetratricopeptide (TPR) repeat protein
LNAGAEHLQEARYAQAERSFLDAQAASKDSRVASTGLEIARKKRLDAEKNAVAALNRPGDPVPHAKVLQASLLVEPASKTVTTALAGLIARAKKSALKPDDVDTAQSLDAAILLENLGADVTEKMNQADAAFAKASFTEAETAYEALARGGEDGAKASKVAATGRDLARARRVVVLKGELDIAKKDGDILRQSQAVQRILELDPNDKLAIELAKKLKVGVVDSRIAAAKAQKEFGKIGVAWLYLRRALELEPGNAKAKAEMESIEAMLKSRLDLVIKVDKIARAPSVGDHNCKTIEEPLRDTLMEDGSKREDLGGYILSKDWTAAVDRQDKEAPQLGGLLEVTLSRCQHGSSVGKATLLWQLTVPPGSGNAAAKGVVEAELPAGLVPRDEQDGEGKNAKKALSRRATKALLDKVAEEKSAVDGWLLVLAEHAMKGKDPALAADAYARMTLKRSTVDPTRVSLVEQFLDSELK